MHIPAAVMDNATTSTEENVQKLQKELFACRSAYATAQRSVGQLAGSLKDSQHEVEALKRTLQRNNADAAELRTCKLKVEELEGTLLSQQRETKLLQSARAVLDEEIKALRAEQAAKSYEIATLQQSTALQRSKMEEQSTQILVLKNQVTELEDEVAAAETDATAAREALAVGRNSEEVDSLLAQVDNLKAENVGLSQQMLLMKADRDQGTDRLQPSIPSKDAGEIQWTGTPTSKCSNCLRYIAASWDLRIECSQPCR